MTNRQARRLRRIVNRDARNAARDSDATALVARQEIWAAINRPTWAVVGFSEYGPVYARGGA